MTPKPLKREKCPHCQEKVGERHLIGCPNEVDIFVKGGTK